MSDPADRAASDVDASDVASASRPADVAPSRARDVVVKATGGAIVGIASGLASAIFLLGLDAVTRTRVAHPAIVSALPLAGLAWGAWLARFGTPVARGTELVLDTIHEGGPRLPARMAPLVLVGTWVTHLFGGSAGREGTAVQMGASFADLLVHVHRAFGRHRRSLLAAGMAGGFGSVFGTPWAGAVFGIEALVVGRLEVSALVPALVASFVGDTVVHACGVVHTPYPAAAVLVTTPILVARWVVFGSAVGIVARVFVVALHAAKRWSSRWVPSLPWRMAIGGLLVAVGARVLGTHAYLGLGVDGILRAFAEPAVGADMFALKMAFTVVTLGVGFVGGEVTPFFFVGAAAGATCAHALGLPVSMGAAVGMATAFGVASRAPLALAIMAFELVGAAVMPHVAIAMFAAVLVAGETGLWTSQRRSTGKFRVP
ncbi:MAG: chloride channel protein [Polyangiaceae bacterium]